MKVKIADIDSAHLHSISTLEKQLGKNICLVAVQTSGVLYAVEAKTAPNQWEPVDAVYRRIDGLKSLFTDHEEARLAKSSLKMLLSRTKQKDLKKRPIRIRRIEAPDAGRPSHKASS